MTKKGGIMFSVISLDIHVLPVFWREIPLFLQALQKATSLLQTGRRKQLRKWKIIQSDILSLSCEAEMATTRGLQGGSIIQHLQLISDEETLKNRMAIQAFIRCTHFLARRNIPHLMN